MKTKYRDWESIRTWNFLETFLNHLILNITFLHYLTTAEKRKTQTWKKGNSCKKSPSPQVSKPTCFHFLSLLSVYYYQPLCHSYLFFPVIYFYLIHNKIRAHFSISTCLHFSDFSAFLFSLTHSHRVVCGVWKKESSCFCISLCNQMKCNKFPLKWLLCFKRAQT